MEIDCEGYWIYPFIIFEDDAMVSSYKFVIYNIIYELVFIL